MKKIVGKLLLFVLVFCVISCGTGEKSLNKKILKEVNQELTSYLEKARIIHTEYFENTKILDQKETKEFVNFLIEKLKTNSHIEINKIINSLDLKTTEREQLLACLKETNGENPSQDCTNRIGKIMTPYSVVFFDLLSVSNNATIKHMIKKGHLNLEISPQECNQLKNGEFYYLTPFEYDTMTIFRKGEEQIQILNNDTIKFKVKWISDCKYQLIENGSKSEAVLTYEIINKLESGYRYVCRELLNDSLSYSEIGIVK